MRSLRPGASDESTLSAARSDVETREACDCKHLPTGAVFAQEIGGRGGGSKRHSRGEHVLSSGAHETRDSDDENGASSPRAAYRPRAFILAPMDSQPRFLCTLALLETLRIEPFPVPRRFAIGRGARATDRLDSANDPVWGDHSARTVYRREATTPGRYQPYISVSTYRSLDGHIVRYTGGQPHSQFSHRTGAPRPRARTRTPNPAAAAIALRISGLGLGFGFGFGIGFGFGFGFGFGSRALDARARPAPRVGRGARAGALRCRRLASAPCPHCTHAVHAPLAHALAAGIATTEVYHDTMTGSSTAALLCARRVDAPRRCERKEDDGIA